MKIISDCAKNSVNKAKKLSSEEETLIASIWDKNKIVMAIAVIISALLFSGVVVYLIGAVA